MPGIVQRPSVVEEAVEQFAGIFANQCQRKHFGNYLTGLMVGRNKTVTGMTSEIVNAKDQSCLNRFLTEVDWDVKELNEQRIHWLQESNELQFHRKGVIALDNVLIDHSGKMIEDVGWFWDHAEERYKIAHDYLFVNYVCFGKKHYPLEFRRFTKKDQCEQDGVQFVNHTKLFLELVDWCQERKIPGTFVFDSFFSGGEILNHINSLKDEFGEARAYVCDLKSNRLVTFKGVEQQAADFAKSIKPEDKKKIVHRNGKVQYYFTVSVNVSKADHKCRVVILWDKKSDKEARKILLTNKTGWDVVRITDAYRDRWTGTETFHRDGKQELGMGACQLRDGMGQTRHMYLVMLAYSLAVRSFGGSGLHEWCLGRLRTVGEVCRAMLDETMRGTIEWVFEQIGLSCGKEFTHVLSRLRLT